MPTHFQIHRTLPHASEFPPEAYSTPKPPPPLSPYHVTKADLGEEESPLPADHTRRSRDWLRSMRAR